MRQENDKEIEQETHVGNDTCCFAIIFSLASMLFTFIIMCICINNSNLKIDCDCDCDILTALSIIVGVLSLLVTLLVGWNIYSTIDTKGIIKKHERLKKRTTKEINKLQELVEEKITDNKRLRNYVNIVQSFTMANVRFAGNEHGDALALYCDSAIALNGMIDEYNLNKNSEEFGLMNQSINMANEIVWNKFMIAGSNILRDRHQEIIDGLRRITGRNTRPIENAIENVYVQK